MEFDWDDHNRAHCQKHGVSIAEIQELFEGQDGFVLPDWKHSVREQRFIAIGAGAKGRKIFVAFTVRMPGSQLLIRPIKARPMHKKEISAYEKAAEKTAAPEK